MDNQAIAKEAAAREAARLIDPGMRVGLGSGSTVYFFIKELAKRVRSGISIEAVATSHSTEKLAREEGIPLLNPDEVSSLDLAVDGADEIDYSRRMIKGGGGALLREKIVAAMAREMIVIVDESKVVKALGRFPLPLEIISFCPLATMKKVKRYGFHGELRKKEGMIYITDNGNYIIDITSENHWDNPREVDLLLKDIPGVLETGFFYGLAGRVIIGSIDGSVRYMEHTSGGAA